MLLTYGPHNVREPYAKPIKGHKKLFELRAKGKDGIARVFYFTFKEQKIILLHGFVKKTAKTPAISRLESPGYGGASISALKKVANALNCELKIRLVPKKG